jgi:single-strand DNA-binding protein
MNTVILTGNLGKDPEFKVSADGKGICNLSLAVGQRVKKDGEWVDGKPMWFQVKFFGVQAEKIVDKFNKGNTVTISGRLAQSWWEKDGVEHTSLDIYGNDIHKVERQEKAESAVSSSEAAPF